MDDAPELHFIDFSGLPGPTSGEPGASAIVSRRGRYLDYLAAVIVGLDGSSPPTEQAAAILDALTVWRRVETGTRRL